MPGQGAMRFGKERAMNAHFISPGDRHVDVADTGRVLGSLQLGASRIDAGLGWWPAHDLMPGVILTSKAHNAKTQL
jgi:hypothetical protein